MALQDTPGRRVLVVLDPDYGERLRDVWPGVAVWVVMSVANAPVVRALWASAPTTNHLTGITGITGAPTSPREQDLLEAIDTIDLHHGPFSSSRPYTTFEVVGATLTDSTRAALEELNFDTFATTASGFVASRSEIAAARLPT